ncbi:MAG: hypothetical protein HY369_00435 [Candidatus Aenigmarchaeota archaeon]|nr:hypothetical protein [Candidatus Aenigmarchaeota archaeon]
MSHTDTDYAILREAEDGWTLDECDDIGPVPRTREAALTEARRRKALSPTSRYGVQPCDPVSGPLGNMVIV